MGGCLTLARLACIIYIRLNLVQFTKGIKMRHINEAYHIRIRTAARELHALSLERVLTKSERLFLRRFERIILG